MKTVLLAWCGVCVVLTVSMARAGAAQSQWVYFGAGGSLVYSNDNLGNRLPDFSYAGYGGGGVTLPHAPVKTNISAVIGDNTANIQDALNAVAAMPLVNGLRGAVWLNPGTYDVNGTLTLGASGVVLRGSGSSPGGSVLHFIGNSRQCFTFQGSGGASQQGSTYNITDAYVPLGATNFNVTAASSFSVGNTIVVRRPRTQAWIDAIGMSNYWSPNSALAFERTITAISGNQVTIDVPLCNPIESAWCTGYIYRVADAGRITNSGIEHLRFRGDFVDSSTNWGGVRALNLNNLKNCWVSDVVVDHFYNGINDGSGARSCTIQDCYFVTNIIPTTSAGAAAFGGSGGMMLYQRCGSSSSTTYHVFVTQSATPGPYVFLNFNSGGNGYDCGPHQNWAAGVLIDNTTVASLTGGNTGIKLENRGGAGSGQGYGAGYSVIYNGNSTGIINEIPQVTNHYNWVIGGVGTAIHRSDDGVWDNFGSILSPRSLYLEQLKERLGGAALENTGYPLFSVGVTPSSQTVAAGSNALCSVTVGDPNGLSNIVALSISGLAAGMSAAFNPASAAGSASSVLTIATSNSVPPGNYPLVVTGTSAGVMHTAVVNLVVASFSLFASPVSRTVLPGDSTNYTITVSTNNNFTGDVEFGVSGLPANAGATFTPSALSGNGTATLDVTTSSNTPSGTYTVTIHGTNASITASTAAILEVSNLVASPGMLVWTARSGTDTNWSNAFNWTNVTAGGYGPPGVNNGVVFTNAGAAGSSALTAPGSGVVIPANISSFASSSFTVQALNDFGNAPSSSPICQNVGIAAGATLSASGGLQVGGYTQFDFGANNVVNLTVSGAGAGLDVTGPLVVSEASGSTGVHNATLDLSGLDSLRLNSSTIKIGIEGGGVFKRATGILYLARTNTITLNTGGNVALYVGHNKGTAPTVPPALYLGESNAIFMANNTGLMIGRANTPGTRLAFNPAVIGAGRNPVAYFRGASASSRVATWSVGDNSANDSTSGNATSATNDFSGGTVDALVAAMQLGVSCPAGGSGTGNGFGTLTFDAGIMDVNALQLGVDTGNTGTSAGIGVVNVNGGTLKVNSSLQLGVFVAGSGGTPRGTLNINGGSVQSANVGGAGGLATINLAAGMLDAQGGDVTNLSTLNVGAPGVGVPATLVNAAHVSAANAITIASNGVIAGNTVVTAPGLVVNGGLSPGVNGVGWMTNNGAVTLGAGGHYALKVRNVLSGPGVGWDVLGVNGGITVQATAANPFAVDLQSLDSGGSGAVTNFDNDTNYDWTIGTAASGFANFDGTKFSVTTGAFANDLAGGYFYARTSGASLILSFTNNHPPATATVTLYRTGGVLAIPISTLAPHWSDPDGDPVTLVGVNGSSTNGADNVGFDDTYIYYTNVNAGADAIRYTVQDVRTNPPAVYQPDDTVRTAAGTVIVLPPRLGLSLSVSGASVLLSGANWPTDATYYVLASTNIALPLSNWTAVGTGAFDAGGSFTFTNAVDPTSRSHFFAIQVP